MSIDGVGNGPNFHVIQGGAAAQPGRPGVPQPGEVPLPENDAAVRARVRMAAGAHQSFESALLSMVEAAGVSGQRAEAVAQTILANDELRAQAERAFNGSRIGSV